MGKGERGRLDRSDMGGEGGKSVRADDGKRGRDGRGGWRPGRVRRDVEEGREWRLLLDFDDGGR